jgi:hypothetical protein
MQHVSSGFDALQIQACAFLILGGQSLSNATVHGIGLFNGVIYGFYSTCKGWLSVGMLGMAYVMACNERPGLACLQRSTSSYTCEVS